GAGAGAGAGAGGAAEVAFHWYAAYNVPRAFPATLIAMSEAVTSFAFRTAAQLGERALEMWDQLADPAAIAGQSKSQLLAETAAALRDAGDGERALAMVDLAIAECPPGDAARRSHLLGRKANYLANVGRPGSIALLREALDLLPPGSNGSLRAAILSALSARLMIEGYLPEAITVAREALAEAQAAGSHRHASVAANMLGLSRIHSGEVEGGMADIERARGLARGDHQALLRYLVNMSDLMYLVGRHDEALRIAEEGIVTARERGVERTSGVVLTSNAVDPLLALGRWVRAEELIDRIRAFEAPLAFRLYVHRAYIWLTLWRGDVAGAEELYRETRSSMTTLAGVEIQTRLGVARIVGEIAAARGDLTGAWAQVEVVLAQERAMPGHDLPLLFLGARVLGAMRAAGGSGVDAIDLQVRENRLRELSAKGAFWPSAPVWIALFDAELGGGALDGSGVEEWRAAVDAVHVPAGQAYLFPYALFRLGRARLAAADRAGATRDLRAAVAAASRIGAGLIEGWVTELAARAGLRLADDAVALAPPGSVLTARERQVLELIGQGLSNRQIGERLFISAKTASVHVSAILRKLGAASRTEAVFLGGQLAELAT
ncbi:LuxR C-terminal-related transcriptional regulator, partial [Pengzhenrongella sp.]|uniref:LuxR C-terminal-related transcriptional regulator n=1 Tax=Pengzhenrongella sp. TaxID=2888820 RepID=UPI002F91F1D1